MNENQTLETQLSELITEHSDLDASIKALEEGPLPDRLQLQRLKKKKLLLKDRIERLRDQLHPDIIA